MHIQTYQLLPAIPMMVRGEQVNPTLASALTTTPMREEMIPAAWGELAF